MNQFKIYYPIPPIEEDLENYNIDLNVVFSTGEVYFATAFTPSNLGYLMDKLAISYFWASDMFVVRNLKKTTLREAIQQAIDQDCFTRIFAMIGMIDEVYAGRKTFESIVDETFRQSS